MEYTHTPVLLRECIEALAPRAGGVYVDGTAGLGGHAEALAGSGGEVVCIDRDDAAAEACKARLARFGNVRVRHGNFCEMDRLLDAEGIDKVDGVLLDLGVSSMQLDAPERGFSYRFDAPLDMRMDTTQPLTAGEVVNEWEYRRLIRILYDYGEERYAPQIARGIVSARPVKSTAELTDAIVESMPPRGRREAQHPARRTYQAIRIAVNGELESLERGLAAALDRLRGGGRLAVIAFHSLEDRIVKRVLADAAKGCTCPPSFPACTCGRKPVVRLLGRVKPSQKETEDNPRSASAVLRIAEKIQKESASE